MIYFAKLPTGSIKIGCTSDVPRRLAQLSDDYGCQIELMGTMRGGPVVELRLHRHFSNIRLGKTEQFQPADELLNYINSLSNGGRTDADDPSIVQTMKFKPIRRVTVAFCLDQRMIEEIDGIQASFPFVTNRSSIIRDLLGLGLDAFKAKHQVKEASRG